MYLSDDVIRYMSVCVDAYKEGPSALLKSSRNSNIRDISMTVSGRDSAHHSKPRESADNSSDDDAASAQAE